jgi:hypothetical protein
MINVSTDSKRTVGLPFSMYSLPLVATNPKEKSFHVYNIKNNIFSRGKILAMQTQHLQQTPKIIATRPHIFATNQNEVVTCECSSST